MKTILDAVNTLKGVWPSESIQIIEIDGVEFSEKEFNAQVLRCSNNVGFPSATAIPIYTQVMFDNGELPSVGMECKIFYNEIDSRFNDFYDCVIEVIAITGDVFTFKNDLYGFGVLKLKLKMLEVIRTPIKLEDGCAYQFELNCAIYVGLYGDGRNAFFTHMPAGNKICGVIEAKNIMKLISKAES